MRGRRDERGAVAVFVAALMVVLLGAAALVVDLGSQRVARADMQALADVVALDLARELDGRTVAEIGSLQALADQSRDRNGSTIGETSSVTPTLWVVDPTTGGSTAARDGDVPNAVRVEARTSVDFAFGLAASGSATRDATAFASPNACLKLGSSALRVEDLLGSGVSLSAVEYRGLATATVVLADLAAQLSAGTVDELLSTRVSLREFYLAVADSLDDSGEGSAASVVRTSLVGLASGAVGLDPVAVGDLLAVGPAGAAALAATVDALSLVTGAAYVANGDNAIAVPVAGAVGDLVGVSADLRVIEPPRIACGGATAETAQVRLELRASVLPPVGADLTASLEVARASGAVSSVDCTDGEATGLNVELAAPTLAVLSIKLDSAFGTVDLPGTAPAQGAGGPYVVSLPDGYDTPRESSPGAGTILPPRLDAASLPAGLSIPGLLRPVVVPLVNTALDVLTGAVRATAATLGLRLASADMYGVRTAQCLNPSLID
ncbi:hypothetical protein GCM10027062_34160 [Nocardioides hungaricus]